MIAPQRLPGARCAYSRWCRRPWRSNSSPPAAPPQLRPSPWQPRRQCQQRCPAWCQRSASSPCLRQAPVRRHCRGRSCQRLRRWHLQPPFPVRRHLLAHSASPERRCQCLPLLTFRNQPRHPLFQPLPYLRHPRRRLFPLPRLLQHPRGRSPLNSVPNRMPPRNCCAM